MQNDKEDIIEHLPVTRWIAAFNAHDSAGIVALYRDDAELFDSGMPHPRHGKAEIERWFRWRFASTPIKYTPTNIDVMEDRQVVVSWIADGRGPRFLNWLPNTFNVAGKSYFTLQDGLILKQHGVYDHLSVLRQLIPLLKWLPASCAHLVYRIYMWRSG